MNKIRYACFEAVAIYGLILGLFGVRWEIYLTFISVAVAALIITFPTEEKWNRVLK